jgi:hypothetical protein
MVGSYLRLMEMNNNYLRLMEMNNNRAYEGDGHGPGSLEPRVVYDERGFFV